MVAICRASKYIKVFHGIKHYDYRSTATTKCHSYSVQFFRLLCSPEQYEGTLIVPTARIEESYTQEINLSGYLHQLLGILNELQCHFQGTAEESERDMDWFEESAAEAIVMITRNGEEERPWLALAREQLETLQGTVVFQHPVTS